MRRLRILNYSALALLLLTVTGHGSSQEANASYKLRVRVNYTGSGTVDQQHKVYVVLWDSPAFAKGEGVMPAGIESTASKDGTVTFDVAKSPAYVSSVYDPSGQWDAQSAPPEGSSIGLYSKTPGTPAPITLKSGETTGVDLSFDDSVKMRANGPGR